MHPSSTTPNVAPRSSRMLWRGRAGLSSKVPTAALDPTTDSPNGTFTTCCQPAWRCGAGLLEPVSSRVTRSLSRSSIVTRRASDSSSRSCALARRSANTSALLGADARARERGDAGEHGDLLPRIVAASHPPCVPGHGRQSTRAASAGGRADRAAAPTPASIRPSRPGGPAVACPARSGGSSRPGPSRRVGRPSARLDAGTGRSSTSSRSEPEAPESSPARAAAPRGCEAPSAGRAGRAAPTSMASRTESRRRTQV